MAWLKTRLIDTKQHQANLVRVGCLVFGIIMAMQLHSAMHPRIDWERLRQKPVKISIGGKKLSDVFAKAKQPTTTSVKNTPKPVAEVKVNPKVDAKPIVKSKPKTPAPKAILNIPSETTPVQEIVKTQGEEQTQQLASAPVVEIPMSVEKLTGQPSIEIAPFDPRSPVLPAISGSGTPPAPGEENGVPPEPKVEYPETPGGNILVMEVFIDEHGNVVDSKIAVPTYKPLADVTLTWAIRQQRWSNINPPMQPGEVRKLVLRFPYAEDDSAKHPQLP